MANLPTDRVQTFVIQNEEWQISDKNINTLTIDWQRIFVFLEA